MLLIILFTFLAVTFGVLALYLLFTGKRQQIVERLRRYADLVPARGEEGTLPEGENGKLRRRVWRRLRPVRRYLAYVEKELSKTTILLRPEEFAAGAVGTGTILFLLLYVVGESLFLAISVGLLGFYLWHFMLARAKRKRVQLFNEQVVDSLELIANGLKSGYSFLQAAELVANEAAPPMATEYKRLLREANLGVNIETALQDLAHRVESEDMELVVTAILIQRQVGGNLAEVLDKISHTIRERVRLQNELRAHTAQGRMSAWVVSLLPPGIAVYIFFTNRQFIMVLFGEPLGRLLLLIAIVMQIFGVLIIRRIVNIEV